MSKTPFCFIDVELANEKRSSICALGIICISDNDVIFEKYYLINPECEFSDRCIMVHGIMPLMVADSPTFPEVWSEISEYVTGGITVAHNAASVEMNAICQSLNRYGLPIPSLRYICTMCTARRLIPEIKYGLHDLCDYFGISLEHHHDAMCDAKACKAIMDALTSNYGSDCYCVSIYNYSGNGITTHSRILPSPSMFDCCKDLCINKRKFCLTGDFASVQRDDLTARIKEKNGIVTTAVSGKTDYLIVGNNGSDKWKFGNFGAKINKVLLYRAEGASTKIISETDFLSVIDSVQDLEDLPVDVIENEVSSLLTIVDPRDFYNSFMKAYPDLNDMFPEYRDLKAGASMYFYRRRVATFGSLKSMGTYIDISSDDVDDEELIRITHTQVPKNGVPEYYRFFLSNSSDHDRLFDILHKIARDSFFSCNGEHMLCCNSFKECSKQMRCLHMGDWNYVGCEYRKNLEKGIRFY